MSDRETELRNIEDWIATIYERLELIEEYLESIPPSSYRAREATLLIGTYHLRQADARLKLRYSHIQADLGLISEDVARTQCHMARDLLASLDETRNRNILVWRQLLSPAAPIGIPPTVVPGPTQNHQGNGEQAELLRNGIIQVYALEKGAPVGQLWCPIAHRYFDRKDMEPIGIIPFGMPEAMLELTFGPGFQARRTHHDNIFFVHKTLARLRADHHFVLIPLETGRSPVVHWKVAVTRPDFRGINLYDDISLDDLDGQELKWQNEARPNSNFLFLRFIWVIINLDSARFKGFKQNLRLVSGSPFEGWGKGLRRQTFIDMLKSVGYGSDKLIEYIAKI